MVSVTQYRVKYKLHFKSTELIQLPAKAAFRTACYLGDSTTTNHIRSAKLLSNFKHLQCPANDGSNREQASWKWPFILNDNNNKNGTKQVHSIGFTPLLSQHSQWYYKEEFCLWYWYESRHFDLHLIIGISFCPIMGIIMFIKTK